MRAIIHITIEDDTPEELLRAANVSPESMRDLYEKAFTGIVYTALAPGTNVDIRAEIEDNTKEANK